MWILGLASIVVTLAWCIVFLRGLRATLAVPILETLHPPEPGSWPSLTVIVPACNEAEQIASAAPTLLGQDYPQLKVVYVDDRSTDGTGELLDSLVARGDHPNLRVIHISELPPGWLGKVHALDAATRSTTGDWILYTDADVHFEKNGVLRRAVAAAEERAVDHLAVIPRVLTGAFWLETLIQSFAIGLMEGRNITGLGKPGTKSFIGSGGFNMVRRRTLESTPGLPWLRMEVIDDIGLGWMLNRHGARTMFAASVGELSIRWYADVQAMIHGFEKNGFAAARFNLWWMLAIVIALLAMFCVPVAGLLLPPAAAMTLRPWTRLAALLAVFCFGCFLAAWRSRFRRPILPALFIPVGFLLFALILLRSSILCLLRGGIRWRGTFYSLAELRKGQRVKW